jgi:hypothetical protein
MTASGNWTGPATTLKPHSHAGNWRSRLQYAAAEEIHEERRNNIEEKRDLTELSLAESDYRLN